jgi:catalase (peroxidase I)
MSNERFQPGETCHRSGQYEIVDNRTGARTGEERTVVSNHTFPPTPKAGQAYVLVDPTRTTSAR